MPSVVDICNMALGVLGEGTITALDDESAAAALCATNFDAARDFVLEARPWSFALNRWSIAAAVAAPAWGPTKRYGLPAEVLRVVTVSDGDLPLEDWRTEGRYIVTDFGGPVKVLGVQRVEDPVLFSPGFVQALVAYLAYLLSGPLAENQTLRGELWQEFRQKLAAAGALDGVQGRSRQIATSTWLRRARG